MLDCKTYINVICPLAMFDNSYKVHKSIIHTIDFGFYNYYGNLLQKRGRNVHCKQ